MIRKIKDKATRKSFERMGLSLIKKGVIRINKVTRSGFLFKNELENLIDGGLIDALAPDALISKGDINMVSFRMRHIMMPLQIKDVQLPVFGCIFFDSGSRKCEIHRTRLKPLSCRVFPFNEVYRISMLRRRGKIPKGVFMHPMCEPFRLRGGLTIEQVKQVLELESMKKRIENFSFVPLSASDMRLLGIDRKRNHFEIADGREELPMIVKEILQKDYGKERLNLTLPKKQTKLVEHIRIKLKRNSHWWEHIKAKKRHLIQIERYMQKLFWTRVAGAR